jgi:hypothetical protein
MTTEHSSYYAILQSCTCDNDGTDEQEVYCVENHVSTKVCCGLLPCFDLATWPQLGAVGCLGILKENGDSGDLGAHHRSP